MNEKINSQPVAKRFQTREPARVEIVGKKAVLFCRMNNLSKTGAFFEIMNSHFTPRRGEIVRVTVNLKQIKKTHVINGEVVWAKGLGFGVVFTKHNEPIFKLSK